MSDPKKPTVVSMDGTPIYQYGEPAPFEAPKGEMCLEQISDHIEAHLGKVAFVYHELVSDTVHIDVHVVKASDEFPFVQLITSGMSDLPMAVPEGVDAPEHVELLMTLPGHWQLDQESFKDEIWYWPIRLLKTLARFPHKYNTWFGYGHTMPHGDPAEPYASNTQLSGMILLPSAVAPEEFGTLRIDDQKEISFYAAVPLYEEEMSFKLRAGSDALMEKFAKAELNDIVDSQRENVCKKRFGWF